jgi:hypothetical protein
VEPDRLELNAWSMFVEISRVLLQFIFIIIDKTFSIVAADATMCISFTPTLGGASPSTATAKTDLSVCFQLYIYLFIYSV